MVRVVIAGGGTGGHITPALAVAEAFRLIQVDTSVSFLATPRSVDSRMYGKAGVNYTVLDSPRIDTGNALKKLTLPYRFLKTYLNVRSYLKLHDPDIVLGTGGYASFFVILAARSLNIKTVLHESNSIPGRANRIAARFCDRIYAGFYSAVGKFRNKNVVYTGNPVRLQQIEKAEALSRLGLRNDLPVVLFLGGSQGASFINNMALESPGETQVILQCGKSDYRRVSEMSDHRRNFLVLPFSDDMEILYSAADLAVARSGAMTIAELCRFRLPALFIPYPLATDNHQKTNAAEIEETGAAMVLLQEKLNSATLWRIISTILKDPEKLSEMSSSYGDLNSVLPEIRIARDMIEMTEEKINT